MNTPLPALSKGALAGIRVIDFTWIGAGSFTTKLLADHGAEVIKIESRERLDTLRQGRPFRDGVPGLDRSGYFAERNSSKRSITLNMKTPEAQALARRLVATADVLANNFTPGTMEKFGLGYDAVRAFKPDIVYLAMSMQGADGPESRYLGYGLTIGALTSLHALCGLPERDPAGTGTNYPDHVPNPCHAAFATLAALRHRRRTGQGQLIDVAQTEPTICLLGPAVLEVTANGHNPQRRGNQHRPYAPHGVYPCAGEDRWIAIAVPDDSAWRALAQVLGEPAWMSDAAFATRDARWAHRAQTDARLGSETARFDAPTLMTALQSAGVMAGAVHDARDVLEADAQLRHREHWQRLHHPVMGDSVYGASPFHLQRTPGGPQSPAPLLGEHTEEVLCGLLGLPSEEVERLRAAGVLN